MALFKEYVAWCQKKGLKPCQYDNLTKFQTLMTDKL